LKQLNKKSRANRPLNTMNSYYDSIYLSPHLDDVVLSCGGQIFLQGEEGRSVLIVTVMAGDQPRQDGSIFVQELHDRWQLQNDVVARRRAEDIRACRILGADYLYWDIPDCIYRVQEPTSEPLYPAVQDIFAAIHPSEAGLINTLSKQLQNLPSHDHLVVPLGAGNHVDHQITRQAVEKSGSKNLIYYEDYPYAENPEALQAAFQGQSSWQAKIIPLSEEALAAKIEAVASYESQLSTFFNDRADMENAVRRFTGSTGGERVWVRIDY
jgi:LmbE family N-acetylglucosaminyl deacetylase